jgi:hypothetical protein
MQFLLTNKHCDIRIWTLNITNTRSHYWTWSWVYSIHLPSYQLLSLRSMLMLSFHFLGCPHGHLQTVISTKILYAFLVSPFLATYPAFYISLTILTILSDLHNHRISCYVTPQAVYSLQPLQVQIFLWIIHFQLLVLYILPENKRTHFITIQNNYHNYGYSHSGQ